MHLSVRDAQIQSLWSTQVVTNYVEYNSAFFFFDSRLITTCCYSMHALNYFLNCIVHLPYSGVHCLSSEYVVRSSMRKLVMCVSYLASSAGQKCSRIVGFLYRESSFYC